MKRTALAVAGLLSLVACATNSAALRESRVNAIHIPGVHLGQTQEQVRHVMYKGPESSTARTLVDGSKVEVWNYLTDYKHDTNTSITFRNGAVVEIAQTPWLGTGNFNEPRKP